MRNLFFIACAAGIGMFIFWPTKEALDRQIEYAQNTEPSASPEQGNPQPETEAADLDPDPAETEKEIQEPEPEPEPVPQLTFEDVLNDRTKWPSAVRLMSPIELPVVIDGKEYGSRGLPPGTVATLDRMEEDGTLSLRVQSTEFQAHHEETSLMEQVIAAAEAKAEAEAAERAAIAAAEAEALQQPTEEERFAELAERIGPPPFATFDRRWTGRSIAIHRYMRQHAKDPESVEYLDWVGPIPVTKDGEEYWAVQIRYRARNSFGGMTIEEGTFLVRDDRVVAVDIK